MCSGGRPASERLPVHWSPVSWSVDATGAGAAVVAVEVVVVADTGVRFSPAGRRARVPLGSVLVRLGQLDRRIRLRGAGSAMDGA